MIELFGWLGSILLAFCALPQAYYSWKLKRADHFSATFLAMWLGGEILLLIYVVPNKDYPLILNYFLNIVFINVIVYYKLSGKSKTSKR